MNKMPVTKCGCLLIGIYFFLLENIIRTVLCYDTVHIRTHIIAGLKNEY